MSLIMIVINNIFELLNENREIIIVLSALASSMVAFVAVLSTIVIHYSTRKAAIKHEILENRKRALFQALQVIDHVFANTEFGQPASCPHNWNIQKAWDAMNSMIIYCKYQNETIPMFTKAIGLHDPDFEEPQPISPKYLVNFRKYVAKELGLPEIKYFEKHKPWIASSLGAKYLGDE